MIIRDMLQHSFFWQEKFADKYGVSTDVYICGKSRLMQENVMTIVFKQMSKWYVLLESAWDVVEL